MKKLSLFFAAVLLVSFLQVFTAGAAPITPVTGGGTNTSTKPSIGSLLVGANTTTTANSQYGVLPLGTDGQCPIASSTAPLGIAWGSCGSGGGGTGTVGPSTSTYVAVFNASGTVTGYIQLTYNSSTQSFSAPSGSFSGNVQVTGSLTDANNNKYSTSTGGSSGSISTTTTLTANTVTLNTGTSTIGNSIITQDASGTYVIISGVPAAATTGTRFRFGDNICQGPNASGTYLCANPTTFNGDWLNFQVNSSTKFMVNASGTTYIGTSTTQGGALFYVATATPIFYVGNNGNTGVRTTTPASVFQIAYDATSTASTTFALQLGSSALTTPSANGTYFGINAPSTFTGNLFDFQSNSGNNNFLRMSPSALTAAFLTITQSITTGQIFASGAMTIGTSLASAAGTGLKIFNQNAGPTGTSGVQNLFQVGNDANSGAFSPTSGSGQYNSVFVPTWVNQTGNSSGISRGIYIAPTITSAANFRAFEVASYTQNLAPGYAGGPLYGVLFNPYTIASSGPVTVPNAYGLTVTNPIATVGSTTITTSAALYVSSTPVTASTTNAFGAIINAPTGATNNVALSLTGELAFSSSTNPKSSSTCIRVVDTNGAYDWVYWSNAVEVVTTTQPAFCAI